MKHKSLKKKRKKKKAECLPGSVAMETAGKMQENGDEYLTMPTAVSSLVKQTRCGPSPLSLG